jgi:hypothetical protein
MILKNTKLNLTLMLSLVLLSTANAQSWKRYRKEHIYMVGATNFLGDLGGDDREGRHLGQDLDFISTRTALGFGYRYRWQKQVYLRGFVQAGILKGSDRFTADPFRSNRNLNFRSSIVELGGVVEYMISKEKAGHRYNIKKAKGFKAMSLQTYVFGGVSGFFFNPQGFYNNKWNNLHELHTEGRGTALDTVYNKNYSRLAIAIPFGIGTKYSINRYYQIGLEAGFRKVFTDYIDDVSGNYADKTFLAQNVSALSAEMSDLSNNKANNWTAAGQQRGNPKYKDNYMFLMVTLTHKIMPHRTKAKF